MREPGFWYRPSSLQARLLAPVAAIYGAVSGLRLRRSGTRAGVPVICIGNYHVGGAGKTPTVLALAGMLARSGERPMVLSRGYGGRSPGPVQVDPARHDASDVGDEPLMMARHIPVIVAGNRVAGAAVARAQGASVILMDDGFQNPSLAKDASLIVIDATRGLGNGCVFPAGPLRAPLGPQLARTDALIVIGDGYSADDIASRVVGRGGLVARARIVPDETSLARLQGHRVLAFAGIGNPQRFFATLRSSGIDVVRSVSFSDHHPFSASDIGRLAADAAGDSLVLVTTEKDLARLHGRTDLPGGIQTLAIRLAFERGDDLQRLVLERIARARRA